MELVTTHNHIYLLIRTSNYLVQVAVKASIMAGRGIEEPKLGWTGTLLCPRLVCTTIYTMY